MPEYRSPGVYVEEYESGSRAISGVSTSVPGFLGLAKKGPVRGLPQLVTGLADFKRKFGGYLPRAYKDFRFLSYAVEQFFVNGGSRCYVMRVKEQDAAPASQVICLTHTLMGLVITAKKAESGDFKVEITPVDSVGDCITDKDKDNAYTVSVPLTVGDKVLLRKEPVSGAAEQGYFTVSKVEPEGSAFKVFFAESLPADFDSIISDKSTSPPKNKICLYRSYFTMKVSGYAKTLKNLSFNPNDTQYISAQCAALEDLPFTVSLAEDISQKVLFDWVLSKNAIATEHKKDEPFIKLTAVNEGTWGNSIKVEFTPSNTVKVQAGLMSGSVSACQVSDTSYFSAGDIVVLVKAENNSGPVNQSDNVYAVISEIDGKTVKFKDAAVLSGTAAAYYLHLCAMQVKITCDDAEELYEQVTFNESSPNFIRARLSVSELVTIAVDGVQIAEMDNTRLTHPFFMAFPGCDGLKQTITFTGGKDGDPSGLNEDGLYAAFAGDGKDPGEKTGLTAFTDNNEISMICAPGVTSKKIQALLTSHCDNLQSRFAILDVPEASKTVDKILAHRDAFETAYAAMYHPWLQIYDSLEKMTLSMPPSGAVAGIYARVDLTRGVHKAPANEPLRGVMGVSCVYGKGEQDVLNPRGVNLIIPFTGQGIRVWGARTCSSNSLWRYVNVRRLFVYIRESIIASTNWVVFEPNDKLLWLRVKRMVSEFLRGMWMDGALFGSTEEEAFFVDIGETTMTPADIDNGRLICNIGIAPVKPAEFVIFRITQKTIDA